MPRELPLLDETRCTGCGDCVAVCPVACLILVRRKPWLARPGDCVACSLCVLVCPESALSLAEPAAA
jgi:NAD-dependent dihydropyrimidine dehydrogenase PreA subunit